MALAPMQPPWSPDDGEDEASSASVRTSRGPSKPSGRKGWSVPYMTWSAPKR